MSAEVKILVEGYTNADEVGETGEERTCPTISLVRDGDLAMVVDPGVLEDQRILIDALSEHGLGVEDINVVCITHSHIDHFRNIGMFPNAKALEYFGVWDKNTVRDWSERFSPNIQIVVTPGHNDTDITLLVATEDGIVAICGDVFWKENYPQNPADDMFASKPEELKKSREMVLNVADWIIPGHGKMYKSKKTAVLPDGEKADAVKRGENGFLVCKKCRRAVKTNEKCLCRPYLCYRCCECGLDCDNCSCSHKRRSH